jgi:hypothetical protein
MQPYVDDGEGTRHVSDVFTIWLENVRQPELVNTYLAAEFLSESHLGQAMDDAQTVVSAQFGLPVGVGHDMNWNPQAIRAAVRACNILAISSAARGDVAWNKAYAQLVNDLLNDIGLRISERLRGAQLRSRDFRDGLWRSAVEQARPTVEAAVDLSVRVDSSVTRPVRGSVSAEELRALRTEGVPIAYFRRP